MFAVDLTTLGDEMRERVRVRVAVLGHQSLAALARAKARPAAGLAVLVRRLPNVNLCSVVALAELLEVTPGWLIDGDLAQAIPARVALDDDRAFGG